MTAKTGLILHGDTRSGLIFILEDGDGRKIHRCVARDVVSNLDAPDQRSPARLSSALVHFALTAAGEVATLTKTGTYDSFAVATLTACDSCRRQRRGFTGCKGCGCGNEIFSSYKHCEVCAVEKRQCLICGASL